MNRQPSAETLALQLANYHQKRTAYWLRIFFVMAVSLLLSIGCGQLYILYRVSQVRKAHHRLTREHTTYAKQWSYAQKRAKQAKFCTKLISLVQKPLLHNYLTILSESLSDETIITSFVYQAPSTITVYGYTDRSVELIKLIETLSAGWQEKVTLIRSSSEPFGISFELSTCKATAKKIPTLA